MSVKNSVHFKPSMIAIE
uniref:Uncharacterized protein n=1 Tax=Rhizophora mucronata TaxID=61149 RepID=A0A2P2Q5R4_RHIMU